MVQDGLVGLIRRSAQRELDARRASERDHEVAVAERLISNTPGWAYKTAWDAAVLAVLEDRQEAWFAMRRFTPALVGGDEILESHVHVYHLARRSGMTHASALEDTIAAADACRWPSALRAVWPDIARLVTTAATAYGRAMEKT